MFAMLNLGVLYFAVVGLIGLILGVFVFEIIRVSVGARSEEMFMVSVLVILAMCWLVWKFEQKAKFFPTFKSVRNAPVSTVVLMTLTNVIGPGSILLPFTMAAVTGKSEYLLLHWAWLLTLPIALVLFALCIAKWRKLESE